MNIKVRRENGPRAERASSFERYVFDSRGRPIKPFLLGDGNRAIFSAVGAAYAKTSLNPVASFDVGFGEVLDEKTLHAIYGAIDGFFTVGLDRADVCGLAGGHRKTKTEDGESDVGEESSDMHLAYVRVLLRYGIQWPPYFEDADRRGLAALQEIINYLYGLSSPKEIGTRRMLHFPDRDLNKEGVDEEWKNEFIEVVMAKHAAHPFSSQADFIAAAKSVDGITTVEPSENLAHLIVGKHAICVKGVLATRWHYTDPTKYGRKDYGTYILDLKRALEIRQSRHSALYGRSARRNPVPWLTEFLNQAPKGLGVFNLGKPTGFQLLKHIGLEESLPKTPDCEPRGKQIETVAPTPPEPVPVRPEPEEPKWSIDVVRKLFNTVIEAYRADEPILSHGPAGQLLFEFLEFGDDHRLRIKLEKERQLADLRRVADDEILELMAAINLWNEARDEDRELGRDRE